MNIKPIKTEEDYQAALEIIEQLMDASMNTPEGDYLDSNPASNGSLGYEPQRFSIDAWWAKPSFRNTFS